MAPRWQGSRRQSGVSGARAVYLGSDGLEACGPGTRRRGSDLRAFAAAASRFAVSLSAASLASRSARSRAVFSASACRGVLALVSELIFFVVLNCSSARRRLASPRRDWERIGTGLLYAGARRSHRAAVAFPE